LLKEGEFLRLSRRAIHVVFVSLLLAGLGLVGGSLWRFVLHPCEVDDVQAASAFLEIQVKQYDEVYMSAASGTPEALNYPITVMEQILVDTQQVDVPACMRTARQELLDYMGNVIRAFRAYESGQGDETVRSIIQQSNAHFESYSAELRRIRECAPWCLR
jgi:hypothetical protein